jgi:hypothetical protein
MPDTFESATHIVAEKFDRYAARGLADDAPYRKEDLRLGLQHLLWALGHLKDAGVSADYREDLAKLAHDAITKRDEVLNRDLDAAGCWAEPVDLTELEKLITTLERSR